MAFSIKELMIWLHLKSKFFKISKTITVHVLSNFISFKCPKDIFLVVTYLNWFREFSWLCVLCILGPYIFLSVPSVHNKEHVTFFIICSLKILKWKKWYIFLFVKIQTTNLQYKSSYVRKSIVNNWHLTKISWEAQHDASKEERSGGTIFFS